MTWLRWSAAVTISAFAGAGAQAETRFANDAPALRVFIYDWAGVPEAAWERAREQAGGILRVAGVELQWRACGPEGVSPGGADACRGRLLRSDLVVRIQPQRGQEYRRLASGAAVPYEVLGHALCVAEHDGVYINIYWKSLLRMARGSEERRALLFGYGLAHEIGHLLLGVHTTGLMAPDWAERDVLATPPDELRFSGADSRRLVERARARLAAPDNVSRR